VKEKDLVSVLINCYNYGRFVAEAIESALEQTYTDLEIIVVDDGSTDDSVAVVQNRFSNDSRIKLIQQRNGGQMSAYVTAFEHCTGDILCMLDADDRYERNHLENVVNAFARNKDTDFLFTAHRMFGDRDEVVQQAPEDQQLGYSLISAMLERFWVGSISSTLALRRSLMLTILPAMRQAAPRWRVRADDCLVYGASLALSKKFYLAEPTVLYRVHGKNSWLDRGMTLDEVYSHNVRRETFAHVLGDHLGLGVRVELPVDWEFYSIQRPTLRAYKAYLRANRRLNRSLPLRWLRIRLKLYRHYRKNAAHWK
jgi:glycosyltransferase involved in cell wall biosynthesis